MKQKRYYDPGAHPQPRRAAQTKVFDEYGVRTDLHVEVAKMTRQLRRQMQRQIWKEGK